MRGKMWESAILYSLWSNTVTFVLIFHEPLATICSNTHTNKQTGLAPIVPWDFDEVVLAYIRCFASVVLGQCIQFIPMHVRMQCHVMCDVVVVVADTWSLRKNNTQRSSTFERWSRTFPLHTKCSWRSTFMATVDRKTFSCSFVCCFSMPGQMHKSRMTNAQ